jgi:aminoglycoside phosphotransferase (APT) family kinase protein
MFTPALYRQTFSEFLKRFGDHIDPAHAELCKWLNEHVEEWFADMRPPQGLVHGDFRLDNVLFTGDKATVIDWQTVS